MKQSREEAFSALRKDTWTIDADLGKSEGSKVTSTYCTFWRAASRMRLPCGLRENFWQNDVGSG